MSEFCTLGIQVGTRFGCRSNFNRDTLYLNASVVERINLPRVIGEKSNRLYAQDLQHFDDSTVVSGVDRLTKFDVRVVGIETFVLSEGQASHFSKQTGASAVSEHVDQ